MTEQYKPSNVFLVYWCNTGLESITDIKEAEQKDLIQILKGTGASNLSKLINSMSMRARFNPQRHYELYSIHTSPEISKNDLIKMFNDAPQEAAELIRSRGNQIFGRGMREDEIKIRQ